MSTLWEKDTPITEWNKIKKLTLKEKAEYIWNYYKWPIIIIGMIAIFIISSYDLILESTKDTVIRGIMINKFEVFSTNVEYFPETYADFRSLDTKKQNVELPCTYYIDMDGKEDRRQETLKTYQTLMAEIASKDLDFLTADQETLALYNQTTDVFYDLRECLPTELFNELEKAGKIVWIHRYNSNTADKTLIESEETYPLLIDFSDSHLPTGMNLIDKELCVAFIINSKRVDEFPYFIDYMLNYVAPEETSSEFTSK